MTSGGIGIRDAQGNSHKSQGCLGGVLGQTIQLQHEAFVD
jgi:hypothetical protein